MPESDSRSVSRVATAALWLGAAAVALAALGVLAIHAGALSPFLGFRLFLLAALDGLVALLLGLVGLVRTRGGRDATGRRRAAIACACGGALVAVVVAGAAGGSGAIINDVTTDLHDPPAFASPAIDPENLGRDMGFPPAFAPIVRDVYPDLRPIELPLDPAQAFDRSLAAAEELGWHVVWQDPAAGGFEAQSVSKVFRFVDDVRVRVRPAPGGGGSVVDVRSKSRVGRGDMGANAARIRAFAAILR